MLDSCYYNGKKLLEFKWEGFGSFCSGILICENKIIGMLSPKINPDVGPCLWYFNFAEDLEKGFSVGPYSHYSDAQKGVIQILESAEYKDD